MLTAFLIFGCATVFASLVLCAVFFISLWREHRKRQADREQSLAILRANRFLQ